jgi:hypothetical protein
MNYSDLIIPLISVPTLDRILCGIFGTKSRWFQLHSLINGIIVYMIFDDVIDMFTNPLANIREKTSKMDSYFIMILHIYHLFIVNNLTALDYFHHILFVGLGVAPSIFYYNSNLVSIAWFPTCGLPGCIEYFTLALVKHDKLESITQKRLNSYIYNYIRYPVTVYGPTLTYIAYKNNRLLHTNPYMLLYFNFILFFNGAFYNKVTVENYILHKYKRNNSFNDLKGLHG